MIHDGGEDLKNSHHDGVFGNRVGFFETAAGDSGDDGFDGVSGAGRAVVENAEFEDFKEGGKGDGGGGRRNVVGLNDVEEGNEIN